MYVSVAVAVEAKPPDRLLISGPHTKLRETSETLQL